MMFRFAYPVMFFLVLPALGWLAFALFRKPKGITYSMASPMAALAGGGTTLVPRIPTILRACCLLLLMLAAARPQLYNVSRDIRSPGVDIMLCLDTSGSMQALDFKVEGKFGDPPGRGQEGGGGLHQRSGRPIVSVWWFSERRPLPSRP